jgi:FlaA1/EpsC-like NDP-sugar epimerase
MAHHLIRLSGLVPEEEIPIVFTGLRPGEKLYEELIGVDERMEPSGVEAILRVHPAWRPRLRTLTEQIDELDRLAARGATRDIVELLGDIVPTFRATSVSGDAISPSPRSGGLAPHEPH